MKFLAKVVVLTYVAAILLFSYQEGIGIVAIPAAALVVFFLVFRSLVAGNKRSLFPRLYIEHRIWILWLILALIGSFIASDQELAAKKLLTLVQLFVVNVCLTEILISYRAQNFMASCIILCILSVAVVTIIFPERFSEHGRLYGTLANANTFGIALAFTGIFITGKVFDKQKLSSLIPALAVLAFLLYVILLTGSRQSLIVFIMSQCVMFVGFAYVARRRTATRIIAVIVPVLAVILASFWLTSASMTDSRITGSFDSMRQDGAPDDASAKLRIYFYKQAAQIALTHPFVGIGLDNFRIYSGGLGNFTQAGTYSHSNYMEIAVSTGLVGFAVYLAIYFYFSKKIVLSFLRQQGERELLSCIKLAAFAMAIFVLDFFTVSYYSKMYWIIFSFMLSEFHLGCRVKSSDSGPMMAPKH